MHYVFVHGWGFHNGIWSPLIESLRPEKVSFIDLGFVRGGPPPAADIPSDAICVGHSLGVLWLLKQTLPPMKALISVCGFDCFFAHADPKILRTMRAGLARNPEAQLRSFWTACGAEPFCTADQFVLPALAEGLTWLETWDAREAHRALTCPRLALAAADDLVVRQPMSEVVWSGETLVWSDHGGHLLPAARPDWCAQHIKTFADDL